MTNLATFWGLLRAVLVGLLLAVLLLRVFEDRLVFFPVPASSADMKPADVGLQAEEVFLATSDGVRLHAWLAPTKEGRAAALAPTILYFHGNAGNLSDRLETIAFLRTLPANVLAVDYRGYGQSEGRPSEEGVYRDAEAAYDYLTRERGVAPERIVVLGQSLGTAVAVDLATKRPVAGLILESGFPSAPRLAQRALWLPGLRFVIRARFDSAAKLKQIHVPVLVAHCRQDPVIPYEMGEELYAAASQPKTFVSYPGNCHEPLYIIDPTDYAAKLRAFLESATKPQRHED